MKSRLFSGKFYLLLAAALVLLSSVAIAEPMRLTFLHTNDLDQISGVNGHGGFAELMTLLREERKRSPNAITTFGGDLISPSILSGLTKGTQMIELMNAVGTDVAVLGNHEFDFGPDVMTARVGESSFPWLGTNVFDHSGKLAVGAQSMVIIEVGGFKVGFFGITTPETAYLSSPGDGIIFGEIFETAHRSVQSLKEQGAEIIVALTHMDFAEDRKLAETVKGLHLVLAGHDHVPATFVANGVTVMQSGSQGMYLGVVDLDVEWVEKRGKKKLVVLPSWRMILNRGVLPDPEIKAIVDKYEQQLDKELGIAIGKTLVSLDTRRGTVRSTESNFANLIVDAMKEEVGADIGFTNGGGIRGDKVYEAGTILTRKDVLTELPFGNVTVLVEVTGSDVREIVETGVSKVEDVAGRFGHY
ncbi:MAG: bifunctional metallophosphatase/5'-nucleotidase, partial [Sneathiella sp.]